MKSDELQISISINLKPRKKNELKQLRMERDYYEQELNKDYRFQKILDNIIKNIKPE